MQQPPSEKKPVAEPYPSPVELYAMGKNLREKCPRKLRAVWKASDNRPDPLRLLEQSNKGRIPELIPIRYGRMVRTPFTFHRGAALTMAVDLVNTPTSGLRVQACGDSHLLNFGAFATPERWLIFDINDLDETLPAPWGWDVKRLAASVVLAYRSYGFSKDCTRDTVLSYACSYREHIAEYSHMPVLEVWYASIDIDKLTPMIKNEEARRRRQKRLATARAHVITGRAT